MKKIISVIAIMVILLLSCTSPAYSAEDTYIESKWTIRWMDHIYYIRLSEDVSAVGDDFLVEYTASDSEAVSVLDAEKVSVYTEDRVEIVFQFPVVVSGITVHDLVLNDGKHIEQKVQTDTFQELHVQDLDNIWLSMKRDALYLPKILTGSINDCEVAVGSRWKLRFFSITNPRDPYLRSHFSLMAEGIELSKNEDRYTFESEGQGKVSLCLFDIPLSSAKVNVIDKRQIKLKMLYAAPLQYSAFSWIGIRYLGPLAPFIGIPFAVVYTLITYFRLIFA